MGNQTNNRKEPEMKEQIIKKPNIYDYPSTDERTFVELDGKVNWEKYAKALDDFIVKLIQCKNIIAKVKEANTPDKRSFEEAEADKAEIRGEDKKCENCKWFEIGYGHCNFCVQSKWMHANWEPIKTE